MQSIERMQPIEILDAFGQTSGFEKRCLLAIGWDNMAGEATPAVVRGIFTLFTFPSFQGAGDMEIGICAMLIMKE